MQRLRIALLLLGLTTTPALLARADDAFLRTGTLSVSVSDDFSHEETEFQYQLRSDDGGTLRLRFAIPPGDLRTGDRIAVHGRPRPDAFDVDEVERLSREPLGRRALSAYTTGPKKVLVILLNFLNDTSQPVTVAQAQNVFFGATGSVAKYYAEASYGQVTMTGDVTPWLTATVNKPTTCDIATIETQAHQRAQAAGYNFANYNFWLYVFPTVSACGWNGLGWVGAPGAWINGGASMTTFVAGHEMGHNFGLLHAHSLRCGTASIGPTCTRVEYGDVHDIMGVGFGAVHFNAYSKNYLGWLPGIAIHPGDTATYTLGALEVPAQTLYAVKVPTTMSARTYWIEWRNRSGFDGSEPPNIANGALVRLGPSAVGGTDLLDMTPATPTFNDAELDVLTSFTDAELDLTISTLSKTSTSLTVQVEYTAAPPPPPATSYHTLTPCRVFDTRNANGPYGGPAIFAGSSRTFVIKGQCGVSATAKAIAGNFTVTGPTAAGSLRVVPGGTGPTDTTTVSFSAGQTRANNVTTGLGTNGDLLVDGLASGSVHAIFDVVGWFE